MIMIILDVVKNICKILMIGFKKGKKGGVAMKEKRDFSKVPFTGMGLVFGTAVGAVLSIAITGNVLWAGIGTGIGLVVGAIIDAYKKKQR